MKKDKVATVRIMFELEPGYCAPSVEEWSAYVRLALAEFYPANRSNKAERMNSVCHYADATIIDTMLIDVTR